MAGITDVVALDTPGMAPLLFAAEMARHLLRLFQAKAQRQRQNAGMYRRENSMLPEEDQQRLLFEGGYPVLAKVAKRKGLPYPHVNEQGEVEADAAWWATMQAAK